MQNAIDHLAFALPAWQLDTHVLFWRSLFGLSPQPLFDLPDPFGLIQSRAMVNESGTLRLIFNVSEAQNTVDEPLRFDIRRRRRAAYRAPDRRCGREPDRGRGGGARRR